MEQMPESRPRKQCGAVGRTPEEEPGGGLASLMQGTLFHLLQSCSPLCKMEPYRSPGPTQSYMQFRLQCPLTSLSLNSYTYSKAQPQCHLLCEAFPDHVYPRAQSELLCTSLALRTSLDYWTVGLGAGAVCLQLHRPMGWIDKTSLQNQWSITGSLSTASRAGFPPVLLTLPPLHKASVFSLLSLAPNT